MQFDQATYFYVHHGWCSEYILSKYLNIIGKYSMYLEESHSYVFSNLNDYNFL